MKSPVDKHIVLASNSPRRRQLLGHIIPEFDIAPARDIDETYPHDLDALEVAPYVSLKKAEGYADLVDKDTLLITADTVVIIDNQILGKPRSAEQALQMLKTLSGRMHRVVTGVTLKSVEKTLTFSNVTEVYFDDMTDDELMRYIDEFKPFDKAGSYGIQEWIGCRGIKGVKGCFYNVMGLPMNDLYNHLNLFLK